MFLCADAGESAQGTDTVEALKVAPRMSAARKVVSKVVSKVAQDRAVETLREERVSRSGRSVKRARRFDE
jgi:hypothetical protein